MKNKSKTTPIIILLILVSLLASCKKNKDNDKANHSITTNDISEITMTTAICGGVITSENVKVLVASGIVWGKQPSPTYDDNHTKDVRNQNNTFSSYITGMEANTKYYARSYTADVNGVFTYGNEVSFTTGGFDKLSIGDHYAGGIVIYFFENGEPGYVKDEKHGIVVADKDLGEMQWGCGYKKFSTYEKIGMGGDNTKTIILYHNDLPDFNYKSPYQYKGENYNGTVAAKICVDLTFNSHSDWYMPSIDEMDLVYKNLCAKRHNSFLDKKKIYWSSSEHNILGGMVWGIEFTNGTKRGYQTYIESVVLPVRNF